MGNKIPKEAQQQTPSVNKAGAPTNKLPKPSTSNAGSKLPTPPNANQNSSTTNNILQTKNKTSKCKCAISIIDLICLLCKL